MIQEKILKSDDKLPKQQMQSAADQQPTKDRKHKRIIGGREIVIIAVALALVAIFPTMAQKISGVELRENAEAAALGAAERPDQNFAGSAFYFMEQDYSIPTNQVDGLGNGTGFDAQAITADTQLETSVGGAASPFIARPGSVDYSRALKCLTDAIYYEAANEPDSGQRGVAQVIINRMRHPTYPNNICGVIYQGSERRTGCQFSYSCDGSMARKPNRFLWNRANRVAAEALAGYVHKPVGMATHYHATYVYPYWAPSLNFIGTIGAHRFYKWKGSAGRPSAFFRRYAGREPFPAPKPRKWSPASKPAKALDPIQLQQQYEREYAAARLKAEKEAAARRAASRSAVVDYGTPTATRQKAAPVYSAPDYSAAAKKRGGEKAYAAQNLPQNSNVRPEFQNSGSWKKQPGG